jgi:sialate O-acetylesterase
MEKDVWPELREAQLSALELPDTAVVTTIDVGDPQSIHPIQKKPVGKRLVLSALRVAYGMGGALCPLYDAWTPEGKRARITFKNAPGGLKSRGGKPKGFEVSGGDGKYVPARAKIEKSSVVVWNDSIPKIFNVRYAWADNPKAELFNKMGLPLSPFRTDRFPGLTAGRR